MPWSPSDAMRFTKKANTDKKRRQWAHVANGVLGRGGSKESAIRQANAVVSRSSSEGKGKKRKKGRVKAAIRILKSKLKRKRR